jgi:acyl dehydratase
MGSPVPPFLPVSFIGRFISELLNVGGYRLRVNYGLNQARFLSPCLIGDQIRAHITVGRVIESNNGYVEAEFNVVIEIKGKVKPSITAIALFRYYF